MMLTECVHTCFTVDTCKARLTPTAVHVDKVITDPIDTWGRLALIDVCNKLDRHRKIFIQSTTSTYVL